MCTKTYVIGSCGHPLNSAIQTSLCKVYTIQGRYLKCAKLYVPARSSYPCKRCDRPEEGRAELYADSESEADTEGNLANSDSEDETNHTKPNLTDTAPEHNTVSKTGKSSRKIISGGSNRPRSESPRKDYPHTWTLSRYRTARPSGASHRNRHRPFDSRAGSGNVNRHEARHSNPYLDSDNGGAGAMEVDGEADGEADADGEDNESDGDDRMHP